VRIAEQTNNYYSDFTLNLDRVDKKRLYLNNWENINYLEIKAFVGITFLMGINKRFSIEDHWNTDELLNSVVSEKISFNKFLLLWKF
jgi:hypothetical protein